MRVKFASVPLRGVGLWLSLLAVAFGRTELLVELKARGQRIPIAVVGFGPGPSQEALSVLRQDLSFSDIFEVLEAPVLQETTASLEFLEPDRRAAVLLSLAYLVKLSAEPKGEEVGLEAAAFEAASGRRAFQQKERAAAGDLRPAIHRIADGLVRALTGEPGVARTRIAFINDSTGSKELYVMDSDGHRIRRLTQTGAVTVLPAWSSDGKKIYFTDYSTGNPDLYAVDAEGGRPKPVSRREGLNAAAAVSPDGEFLALTLSFQGDPEIYLIRPSGTLVRRLTRTPGSDTSPTFSPNGRRLAFASERQVLGRPGIFTMDLSGQDIQPIDTAGFCDQPDWSPTGDRIAYSRREDGRFQIYLADIFGQTLVALTRDPGSQEHPSFSPDGRHIVFASNRTGRWRIYRMRADGSHVTLLGDLPGNSTTPAWSPVPQE